MKKELTLVVLLAGFLGNSMRGNGLMLATELDRKRLSLEVRENAAAAKSEPVTGSERWDNDVTPQAAPNTGERLYKVMSMATISTVRSAPAIKTNPGSVTVTEGQTVTLRVTTSGYPIPTYQWRKNGDDISGARFSTYSFSATQAGAADYDVVASNPEGVAVSDVATVTVKALPKGKLVGTFHGLIERDSVLNKNLGSSFQITTTKNGAFSGKIVTGVTSIPISGAVGSSFTDLSIGTISVAVAKLGATLDLTLDASTDSLSGTLRDGGANSASISGWRNGWADVVGNAVKYKGLYTVCFGQTDPSVSLPQGYGFGSFTVAEKTGLLMLAGMLPDGSKLTGSTFVGQAGQVLVYVPLYTNLGSFTGTLTVTPGVAAPVGNSLDGSTTWMRPDLTGKSKDTVYRSGFGPIPLTAAGGIYTVPAKGARVFGLAAGTNNAEVVFSSGGLDSSFTQSLTITNPSVSGITNKVTVGTVVNKITWPILTPSTGAFSGDFTLANPTRKAPFNGQIVTVSGVTKGYGFFLLPKVPGVGETVLTSPKLSGSVTLRPATP